MDIAYALSVIFTGISIVFLVLIALILVMVVMGKVLGGTGKKKDDAPSAPVKNAPAAPAPKAAPPQMAVQSGTPEEVVSVISAAIAAFTGGKGRITSIRRAKKEAPRGRSAWSMAGLRENTQPF
ncbi:OadG family protein [Harryflintia acetispora]|uniref:OadG family protein n=1 Tax=Harryflintia acetispora TaxID=1849041 RepID=UPI00189BA552|nr:OadG family protein [Harryflintia acetispora]